MTSSWKKNSRTFGKEISGVKCFLYKRTDHRFYSVQNNGYNKTHNKKHKLKGFKRIKIIKKKNMG